MSNASMTPALNSFAMSSFIFQAEQTSIYSNSNFMLCFQQILLFSSWISSLLDVLWASLCSCNWAVHLYRACSENSDLFIHCWLTVPLVRAFLPCTSQVLTQLFCPAIPSLPHPHAALCSPGYQLRLLTAPWGGDGRLAGTWDFLNRNLWQMSFYYLFPCF